MWKFGGSKKTYYFCTRKSVIRPLGAIAQLVEQRTENPCVPGSIPGGTTTLAFLICTLGAIAQLVEQRTENPCVPGSIPGGTTRKAVSRETAFSYSDERTAERCTLPGGLHEKNLSSV